MGLGYLRAIALAFVFVVILGVAFASCSISIDNQQVELRSNTDGYATSISAEDGSPIDIKVTFDLTDVSGNNCANDVRVSAKMYRETDSTSFTQFDSASTKTQELAEDSYTFTWSDEFNVSDNYTRYRVDANIVDSNGEELDTVTAYIDMTNNSCSGINLVTSNFSADESDSTTKSFRIENNTSEDFEIDSLDVTFTSSLIQSGSLDYDTVIDSHDTTALDVTVETGSVSSDSSTTGTLSVSGYLGDNYCSETEIGRKSFTVTVENTGSSNNSNSDNFSSIADCEDLSIVTRDFTMNDNSDTTQIFYLQNDATKRFEIKEIQVTSNGVDLTNYYNEQYAFPGTVADIVLKAVAPNLFSSKTYSNTIKVRGSFSDGKSCSFNNIQQETFNVTVEDTTQSNSLANCTNFSISAPSAVSFENFGTIPITITNGTNQRADIFVEGSVNATPTQISLPENSAISRNLSVSLTGSTGTIVLRPSVAGCDFVSKTITINNTAKGELSALTMSTSVQDGTGGSTLLIEVDNPTSKIFTGVISVDTPNGWFSDNTQVTVTPGKNTFTVQVQKTPNAVPGTAIVSFKANGDEITQDVPLGGAALAGLFSLGGVAGGIIALLLILVVVVLLVGLIQANMKHEETEEAWMEKN